MPNPLTHTETVQTLRAAGANPQLAETIAKGLAHLATKADLTAAVKNLATRADVAESIAKSIEPLATQAELAKIAEQLDANNKRLDQLDAKLEANSKELVEQGKDIVQIKMSMEHFSADIKHFATKADIAKLATNEALEKISAEIPKLATNEALEKVRDAVDTYRDEAHKTETRLFRLVYGMTGLLVTVITLATTVIVAALGKLF